ncbi:thioredoxin-like protein 1-2, chloroplastic [Cinnamomum micranthum f. kanehirae]|uniref:Thioredoxin-like protein 1-2, chloroplastic n=1 Tax=Cinnamomum micranthum f. kanehirae TaxID=337451 RepID=A0A3S3MEH3_9MAGN|nr:thioredoxin-like protein 1-2, chloroplastic [Cinnamomum micranthum f. kanehirae]
MADVLSKMDLSPPCPNLCSPITPKKSPPSSIGFSSLQFQTLKSSSMTHFNGQKMAFAEELMAPKRGNLYPLHAQMNYCISKALRWWEKGLQSNMKEIQSAMDLMNSLLNAGNNLVVVDFFSPGCGGCKALHPKICQLAEQNPEIQFLQVNYEQHKSMCYSLNVHVLPFFRFYRGAQGRVCSFSCTNATIKKFKDALAKHTTDRCSLGPSKGLEESELIALAANRDLSFNYTSKLAPASAQEPAEKAATSPVPRPLPSKTTDQIFEKTLTMASG